MLFWKHRFIVIQLMPQFSSHVIVLEFCPSPNIYVICLNMVTKARNDAGVIPKLVDHD